MSISQLLPLSAGTFIKDYEIIELLGSGGFGAVYKAKPRNGSFVAIKETYYNDEQELKMFQNEAKLLSSLSDEDFPKVITHFTLLFYIAKLHLLLEFTKVIIMHRLPIIEKLLR